MPPRGWVHGIPLPERQTHIEPRVAQRTLGNQTEKMDLPERHTQNADAFCVRTVHHLRCELHRAAYHASVLYFPFRENGSFRPQPRVRCATLGSRCSCLTGKQNVVVFSTFNRNSTIDSLKHSLAYAAGYHSSRIRNTCHENNILTSCYTERKRNPWTKMARKDAKKQRKNWCEILQYPHSLCPHSRCPPCLRARHLRALPN